MTLVHMVNQVIGTVPPGWEFAPYIMACILSVVVLKWVGDLVVMPLRRFLGRFL